MHLIFGDLHSVKRTYVGVDVGTPTSARGKHRPQIICGAYKLSEIFIDALKLLLK